MARRRYLSTAIVGLTALAVACGGTAAPTATPARPAPTAVATAVAAQPTSAAQATATPTRLAPTPTTRAAASRGKVIYAKPVDMGLNNTVNPAGTAGGPDNVFTQNLGAGLASISPDKQIIPWGAKRWEFSPDQKSITFTIRDDMTFHDGTKVTLDDWLFRFNDLWLNPVQPGAAAPTRPPVPEKIEQTGPDSFRVVFPRPNTFFLEEIAAGLYGVYSKAYIQRVGFDEFYKNPNGAGPYKFVSRSPASSVLFQAHEQFFTGPPAVKTIEFRIVPEDSTRVAMFLTGEADIAEGVAPQYLPQVERVEGAKVLAVRSGQEVVIHIHTRQLTVPGTDIPNPFRDIRVRRAIQHAVDRKAIAERIAGRAGVPVPKGPWSDYHLGYDGDNITEYEYNPEKAKQLLREANFPMDLSFPVYAYVASPPAPAAVEAAANYLNAVGLKAQYRPTEVSALMRLWRAQESWPLSFVRSWSPPLDPSDRIYGYYYSQSQAGVGYKFQDDPKFDALYDESTFIAEPVAHNEAIKKLYRYIHEQAWALTLYAIVDNHAVNKRVDWVFPPGFPSHLELVSWRTGYP